MAELDQNHRSRRDHFDLRYHLLTSSSVASSARSPSLLPSLNLLSHFHRLHCSAAALAGGGSLGVVPRVLVTLSCPAYLPPNPAPPAPSCVVPNVPLRRCTGESPTHCWLHLLSLPCLVRSRDFDCFGRGLACRADRRWGLTGRFPGRGCLGGGSSS